MMVHWPSYLYIYPTWTDILAYYTDRITDVTRSLLPLACARMSNRYPSNHRAQKGRACSLAQVLVWISLLPLLSPFQAPRGLYIT
jgi:hypothetical protein